MTCDHCPPDLVTRSKKLGVGHILARPFQANHVKQIIVQMPADRCLEKPFRNIVLAGRLRELSVDSGCTRKPTGSSA